MAQPSLVRGSRAGEASSIRLQLRFVTAGVLFLLPARGTEGQERRPFGRWTVSVVATAGQNFLRTFDTSQDKSFSEMGTVAVKAEKFVSRRIEIGLAVHPLMVISQPETRDGRGHEDVGALRRT